MFTTYQLVIRISQPFTVAMENGMFVQDKHDDLPSKDCDFHWPSIAMLSNQMLNSQMVSTT